MESKKSFRQQAKKKRDSLSADVRQTESRKILQQLVTLSLYQNSKTIFTYYSVGSEVDTLDFIQQALSDGKRIFLPVCGKNHSMNIYEIHSLTDVVPGAYDIPVPADCSEPFAPEALDMTIVPGLCFDSEGYRMGYGGGYYDRFLPRLKAGTAVGVCYTDMLVPAVPRDEFDRKCDRLVTANGVIAL